MTAAAPSIESTPIVRERIVILVKTHLREWFRYRLPLSMINAARRLSASWDGCDVSYLRRSSP